MALATGQSFPRTRYKISTRSFSASDFQLCNSRNNNVKVSPRIALALCGVMRQGMNVPMDSKVHKVYLDLMHTSYYDSFVERVIAEVEQQIQENLEEKRKKLLELVSPQNENLIEVGYRGKLEISFENLVKLVQCAAKTMHDEQNTYDVSESSEFKKRRGGRQPIPIIAKKQGFSREFRSQTEFAKYLGVDVRQVNRAVNKKGTVRGYEVIPA